MKIGKDIGFYVKLTQLGRLEKFKVKDFSYAEGRVFRSLHTLQSSLQHAATCLHKFNRSKLRRTSSLSQLKELFEQNSSCLECLQLGSNSIFGRKWDCKNCFYDKFLPNSNSCGWVWRRKNQPAALLPLCAYVAVLFVYVNGFQTSTRI